MTFPRMTCQGTTFPNRIPVLLWPEEICHRRQWPLQRTERPRLQSKEPPHLRFSRNKLATLHKAVDNPDSKAAYLNIRDIRDLIRVHRVIRVSSAANSSKASRALPRRSTL